MPEADRTDIWMGTFGLLAISHSFGDSHVSSAAPNARTIASNATPTDRPSMASSAVSALSRMLMRQFYQSTWGGVTWPKPKK